MIWLKTILCMIFGCKWQTVSKTRGPDILFGVMNDDFYSETEVERCVRCGEQRTNCFGHGKISFKVVDE